MNKKLLVAAGALVAVGLAVGGASTASNTMTAGTQTGGYGTVDVSGAEAKTIDFTHSADGTQVDSASVVFVGNQEGNTVKVGFGTVADKDCTVGTHNATDDTTTATCSALAQDIADAAKFNVSVVS